MIPILFDKSATDWSTNGLGRLFEAISCTVTEERNGEFELEMQYPVTGARFSDLINDNIILAQAYEGTEDECIQPFRIYSISKPLGGKVTVKARHISYQLSYTPVGFVGAAYRSAKASLSALAGAIKNSDNKFTFSTDLTSEGNFEISKPISVRNAIGGDGGFLDIYGGEVKWDKYAVKILSSRGCDHGVTIRYGKNLTDLTQEENIENTYSAIMGYYYAEASAGVAERKIEGSVIKSANASKFPYIRTYIYDVSSDFNDTVIKGYRVGQNFYEDSDHKTAVTPVKNYYYEDDGTVVNGYFNGSTFYEDSSMKTAISPETYKYYSDSNTLQRGYYSNGAFYKDASLSEVLTARQHCYYIDQTNDTDICYVWNGSSYVRQSGLAEDYTNFKAVYSWNGSSYVFQKLTDDATSAFPTYNWRYNGSTYEVVTVTIPTVSDIDRLATAYMNDHDFGVPEVSMTISYQPLWQTEEYKDLLPIESVKLCDTVTVIFDKLGVHNTAKVIKTVYNVLMNRYDSIEIDSDWNKNETRDLSGTIASQSNSIKEQADKVSTDMAAVIASATEKITGGLGGYVKLHYNEENGFPDEILIMDESDYTKAKNVMRLNKNGIGFSKSGYNGPFTSAWTIDGTFNANWITTGLLTAITMQTASSGLRVVIKGLQSAIKGMSGDDVVNIIDMVNGSGTDANLVIDAKNMLAIRTPKMGVIDRSYGESAGTVKQCLTESVPFVTKVEKNMSYGSGYIKTQEVWINDNLLCTLPVYLDVTTSGSEFINGFAVGSSTETTTTI